MIEVSAVCLFDDSGRVLTVRKRGTSGWMLVGGKPEPAVELGPVSGGLVVEVELLQRLDRGEACRAQA